MGSVSKRIRRNVARRKAALGLGLTKRLRRKRREQMLRRAEIILGHVEARRVLTEAIREGKV